MQGAAEGGVQGAATTTCPCVWRLRVQDRTGGGLGPVALPEQLDVCACCILTAMCVMQQGRLAQPTHNVSWPMNGSWV